VGIGRIGIMTEKLIGLYAGIKPNRISLYLLLLQTNRLDELESKLISDMEKDRIKDEEKVN
jgi:hypothetical protein